MNNKKSHKIVFIVFLSLFATWWVASLVFLGFATFSENITESIQAAYAKAFKDKTLDLMKVTIWTTFLSTACLVTTLLFDDVKKKYLK